MDYADHCKGGPGIWQQEVSVAGILPRGLPRVSSTQRLEFRTLLQDRFNQLLLPRITYIDHDGDVLNITTDVVLHQALASNLTTFAVLPQPRSHERDGLVFVDDTSPALRGPADWSQSLE